MSKARKVKLEDGPDGHFVPLDEFFSYWWEPPAIKVTLNTATLNYYDVKGRPFKSDHLYTKSEVELSGEFDAIHVNTEGLAQELQEAIDKIIAKHTKIPVQPRGTSIARVEDDNG